MSGGQTEKQVRLIRDFAPRVILATPSYLLALIDEMERQGCDPAALGLEIGVLGAEPWSNDLRARIEARAHIEALDIYGLSEVIGPGVAQECADAKGALHVWEDHFYPEIIDPDTGMVLPDGAFGELVFTSLTKEALPVIRYRTRDLTRLMPGIDRPMRRMERIMRRSDDMLIVRGVNVFPTQIEELIVREPDLAPRYRIVLERRNALDEMTVVVEPAGRGRADASVAATRSLRERIKALVGVSVSVELVSPGSIEPSAGKARNVEDRRA